jgi:hypothetical protein
MSAEGVEERTKEVENVCPLLSIAFRVLYPCLRWKCAWWGGDRIGCAVLALLDLTSIAEVVGG